MFVIGLDTIARPGTRARRRLARRTAPRV